MMPRRTFDRIVVVDVEATCWEADPPPDQTSEIIEIGVCLLDVVNGERLDRESILVRPTQSSVSAFCRQLTSLTQEQVEQGISFEEACSILGTRFQTRERAWASYGDYDRRMFKGQCKRQEVKYPFSAGHINVKTLLAASYGLKHEIGLSKALRLLGLPLEGTHHRGVDDAWNIAAVLSRIILAARPSLKPRPKEADAV
jgi:inhibitor of KinA sporulation pathway (predicted exonuclease)